MWSIWLACALLIVGWGGGEALRTSAWRAQHSHRSQVAPLSADSALPDASAGASAGAGSGAGAGAGAGARMRAGVCAAMVFLTSTPALADVAPKMTFFESAVESTGPVVYDESEAAVIRERKEAVRKRWQGMAETVRAAESSEGGAAAKARARDLAKNSIANSMNPLKTDMRRISKVLSGGDILVKEGGLSKFDYNSGTFTLQPVAAQAEKVFGAVNEIYFYALGQGGDTLRDGMQEAQGEFELWWGMVQ